VQNLAIAQDPAQAVSAVTTWQIDPANSRVEFSVRKRLILLRHLVVSGLFGDVSGTVRLDEQDRARSSVSATIGVAGINTKQARRDAHLKKADFFGVERYPSLTFASSDVAVIDTSTGRYRVTGDLTIRGVSRKVALDVQETSGSRQASGRRFTATTFLNRRDYGMVWNKLLIDVKDEVQITLDIAAVRA
jgi:polyisoprenoid-binding protein YceI